MIDIIIILILIAIVGSAFTYIYISKKNGQTCIGCPYGKECSKKACDCQSKL
ncbi:MAG: FeoB-associated Cys-rich membrane protein [Lachnospiraceae bacterium]|nr:FeoB-associated Cys-rich membrane protein [Lachnospiraceae bacterium]